MILVDSLRPYARRPAGRLEWCHLVSDSSLDELHQFAAELGVPPRGFHRDHYDLPREARAIAVERGAVEVTSKELVRRMVRPSELSP